MSNELKEAIWYWKQLQIEFKVEYQMAIAVLLSKMTLKEVAEYHKIKNNQLNEN